MGSFEVGDADLAQIHKVSNDKKFFCYFTGFLEGIVASGSLEVGEVEPLLQQCIEFVENLDEVDALDIIEDFRCDILDHEGIASLAEIRITQIDSKCEKSSVNRFLGFVAAIACDDLITKEEAQELIGFAEGSPEVLKDPFARNVVSLCREALDDGVIDARESEEICAGITRLVGDAYVDTGMSSLGSTPDFATSRACLKIEDVEGKKFVLTGNFSVKPRRKIEDRLIELGGETTKSVTQKIDFIVVADEASRDWIHTHKGTKIVKAMELRDSHGRPDFIAEYDLLKLLDLK